MELLAGHPLEQRRWGSKCNRMLRSAADEISTEPTDTDPRWSALALTGRLAGSITSKWMTEVCGIRAPG